MSDPGAAELAALLVGLFRSKREGRGNLTIFTDADASELQHVLAYADIYIYHEDHPGRYYLLARLGPIRIRMYKETQHARPHLHIDYGNERHIASYALDTGERLAGNLDRRYDKAISAWIAQSQEQLFKIWSAIQSGKPETVIAELKGAD